MTNETGSVRRSRLNHGFESTTPAYVMETEDDNYLIRGRLTSESFDTAMNKTIKEAELLDTLTEDEAQEYSEGQVLEHNGEDWIKAEVRLDIPVTQDSVEARIHKYNGPSDREAVSVEDSEIEEMATDALKNFRGSLLR